MTTSPRDPASVWLRAAVIAYAAFVAVLGVARGQLGDLDGWLTLAGLLAVAGAVATPRSWSALRWALIATTVILLIITIAI